jgi:hypothetical protein
MPQAAVFGPFRFDPEGPALMDAAWPGTAVEEANLTVQIAAPRKALWEGPDGRDRIVTLPRLRYRIELGQPDAAPDDDVIRLIVRPFESDDADCLAGDSCTTSSRPCRAFGPSW